MPGFNPRSKPGAMYGGEILYENPHVIVLEEI